MFLGEAVKKYRADHGLSMDDFAKLSGLSKGYISMLEKNRHPRTGKPLSPTIDTYKACASAMGMTLNELLETVDDRVDVTIRTNKPEPIKLDATGLLRAYDALTPEAQQEVLKKLFDRLVDERRGGKQGDK